MNLNSCVLGVGWPSYIGGWIWHGGRREQAREEAHKTHANASRVEQSLQPGLCILGILCLRQHFRSKQGGTLQTFLWPSYVNVALIIIFVCIGTNEALLNVGDELWCRLSIFLFSFTGLQVSNNTQLWQFKSTWILNVLICCEFVCSLCKSKFCSCVSQKEWTPSSSGHIQAR